mmetsp:Transcript_2242/g.3321  ORF Transcript_2242/g.3321 Transcript_2242/m.3321 type:complete len:177 (-) Transcript_2242:243-773(-)
MFRHTVFFVAFFILSNSVPLAEAGTKLTNNIPVGEENGWVISGEGDMDAGGKDTVRVEPGESTEDKGMDDCDLIIACKCEEGTCTLCFKGTTVEFFKPSTWDNFGKDWQVRKAEEGEDGASTWDNNCEDTVKEDTVGVDKYCSEEGRRMMIRQRKILANPTTHNVPTTPKMVVGIA